MDRKYFMKELEYLLSDISEEERQDALLFYENYFDEAGSENEQKVIQELGDPSRVAAMIKDGLKGQFDEGIHASNAGFCHDDYQRNYEIVQPKTKEKIHESTQKIKRHWNDIDSHDRMIFIILGILIFVPISSIIFGTFGTIFGIGFSAFAGLLALIFGIWVITFLLYLAAGLLFIIGLVQIFTLPGAGLICLGVSFIVGALARIAGIGALWFFKDCIPSVANTIVDGVGKLFHPRGA